LIEVTSASVVVVTRTILPNEYTATAALDALQGSLSDLSSALGVDVESVSAELSFETSLAPSPPPPSPPPPGLPPYDPPSSPSFPPQPPPAAPPPPPPYVAIIVSLSVVTVLVIALVVWWRLRRPKTLKQLKLRKKEEEAVDENTIAEFIASGAVGQQADQQEDCDPELNINPVALAKLKDEKKKKQDSEKKQKEARKKAVKEENARRAAQRGEGGRPQDPSKFIASLDEDGAGALAKLGVSFSPPANKGVAPKERALGIDEIDLELRKQGGGTRRVETAAPPDARASERIVAEATAAALEASQHANSYQKGGPWIFGLFRRGHRSDR